MLARTIAAIPASAISSIFDQATALKEGGRDLVDFSIGEPDFDTPAHICEAGAQAIADGITRYTSTDGTAALKDAIARKFLRDNGLKFSRAEIVVGAGAKPLLATAVQAVINPGEEAILTSPAWASHLG
ncbi:MAG: aminotransferase class I/II-fold pyridoxal phosphate-dependent enzyme, partial [Alphaproteobacteria bacterium]|nr:aminotransferase class I/II-fold pyridoxal phosphate-dependent enzyme [Alphaproteobacteria bacterium]